MNKNQIETKRLFWKMVEAVEGSDTIIRNEKGELLERGMSLSTANVMFGVNDGMLSRIQIRKGRI